MNQMDPNQRKDSQRLTAGQAEAIEAYFNTVLTRFRELHGRLPRLDLVEDRPKIARCVDYREMRLSSAELTKVPEPMIGYNLFSLFLFHHLIEKGEELFPQTVEDRTEEFLLAIIGKCTYRPSSQQLRQQLAALSELKDSSIDLDAPLVKLVELLDKVVSVNNQQAREPLSEGDRAWQALLPGSERLQDPILTEEERKLSEQIFRDYLGNQTSHPRAYITACRDIFYPEKTFTEAVLDHFILTLQRELG